MSESRRVKARAPWIVAAVLGAVAVALAAVILFVIHPKRTDNQQAARQVGIAKDAQQAMDAASQEVLNLTTYARKSFEADYARTVAGTAGDLKADLVNAQKKATLLSQMTTGKFDLQGAITNKAFEEAADGKWLILVSSEGYKVPDGGTRALSSRSRFEVTMTRRGGKWFATNLQTVGLI